MLDHLLGIAVRYIIFTIGIIAIGQMLHEFCGFDFQTAVITLACVTGLAWAFSDVYYGKGKGK